jgi:hypothetical protein
VSAALLLPAGEGVCSRYDRSLSLQWKLWLPSFLCLFFEVLEFELRAYTLSHSTTPFLWWIFFKIGSRKLFSQADFEPWSF